MHSTYLGQRIPHAMLVVLLLTVSPLRAEETLDSAGHIHPPQGKPELWTAPDLEKAKEFAKEILPLVRDVVPLPSPRGRLKLPEIPFYQKNSLCEFLLLRDPRNYYLLDSPIIKKEEDLYEPVAFLHAKHASLTFNCAVCHHMRPADPKAPKYVRCSACHQESPPLEEFGKLGLKGAYHWQCVGCHAESHNVMAPTDCLGCHRKNLIDHNELVVLPSDPTPGEVTQECLRCHDQQAEDFMKSAHWLWEGPSFFPEGTDWEPYGGKANSSINNSAIAVGGNWRHCTRCHAGYGWKNADFDFTSKESMDCLVCHDTTGLYLKDPGGAGRPHSSVDLLTVAKSVGKPTRQTCGACHFQRYNVDPFSHVQMTDQLDFPNRQFDVHMGGFDFRCHDCHGTRKHKIAGRSASLPVAEGALACEDCHTYAPHNHSPTIYHLNNHCRHLACTTCHSPLYSKGKETRSWWDWSKAGDKKRKPVVSRPGMPDYDWRMGEFRWKKNVKPEYAWCNGQMNRHQIGDVFNGQGDLFITQPDGHIYDPQARIHAFKKMEGIQPIDAESGMLLVLQLDGKGGFWNALDWDESFRLGMAAVGEEYSGRYEWQRTVMYWGVDHEVMPKEYALSCAQCHPAMRGDRTCDRCHVESKLLSYSKLSNKGLEFRSQLHLEGGDYPEYVEGTDYIDFQKLGYEGDPIEVGGRFKMLRLDYAE